MEKGEKSDINCVNLEPFSIDQSEESCKFAEESWWGSAANWM